MALNADLCMYETGSRISYQQNKLSKRWHEINLRGTLFTSCLSDIEPE